MDVGYDKPLYILPFDHRSSFEKALFGWSGTLAPEQTARIAATKQVICDGFRAALRSETGDGHAGILVDEQFGAAIPFWDALVALLDGRMSHEQAAQAIADRYREWIRVFVSARNSR